MDITHITDGRLTCPQCNYVYYHIIFVIHYGIDIDNLIVQCNVIKRQEVAL